MKKVSLFTLVELLIVICIIIILAGILLPSLSKARGSAIRSKCAGNQKQFALAFLMYVDDFHGFYPPNRGALDYVGTGEHIQTYLQNDYVSNSAPNSISAAKAGIFMCPMDKIRADMKRYGYSYGYNYYIGVYHPNSTWYNFSRKLPASKHPANTLLFADSRAGDPAAGNNWFLRIIGNTFPFDLSKGTSDTDNYIPMWHNNTANIAFLDGHVQLMGAAVFFNKNKEINSMINGGDW